MRLKPRPIARGRRVLGWVATRKLGKVRVGLCVGHTHRRKRWARRCTSARRKLAKLAKRT